MLNKNLKKLDSSGRLYIPNELRTQVEININEKIAICTHEESGGIMIKPLNKIENCKVIAIGKMNNKGKIVIPKILLPEGRNEAFFDVYLFNGDLVIEQIYV